MHHRSRIGSRNDIGDGEAAVAVSHYRVGRIHNHNVSEHLRVGIAHDAVIVVQVERIVVARPHHRGHIE